MDHVPRPRTAEQQAQALRHALALLVEAREQLHELNARLETAKLMLRMRSGEPPRPQP